MEEKFLFKLILPGTCDKKDELIARYTTDRLQHDTKASSGANFATLDIRLPGEIPSTLQLWDFSFEKRFRPLIPLFCEGASGAILFFDLDSPPTFDELIEWLTIIRNHTKHIPIILCGANWAQNVPEHILLEAKDLTDFVKKHKLDGYININTKTGYNITLLFETITKLMIESRKSP